MKGFFTYIAMAAAFTLVILLAVRHDKKIDPRPAPAPKPERKPLTRSEKKTAVEAGIFITAGLAVSLLIADILVKIENFINDEDRAFLFIFGSFLLTLILGISCMSSDKTDLKPLGTTFLIISVCLLIVILYLIEQEFLNTLNEIDSCCTDIGRMG
ncbi:hypothetical protein [Ruminococcus sp.]|uniref:hypothetical protein n=1 Tax=Ruminococcus sp. TaxID=41978 RepID=UPI002BF691C5|nr:hypothetical protein [Ruminococcus sp.]HNZ99079.1 hypothetical protein [Ruminococcus sp.]HOH85959.1 hypothetical protein [Ruminococcus sp.]